MVHITPAAELHINKVLAEEQALFFKIGLSPKGCSGFAYTMSAEKTVGDDCVVYDCGTVRVAVPKDSDEKLANVTLDWKRDGLSSRLSVENPKVVNTCGCGSSVMFK